MAAVDKSIHNTIHKSLRESLVDVYSWMKHVRSLEAYGNLDITFTEPDRRVGLGTWVIPYPYKVPYYVDIYRMKHPEAKRIQSMPMVALTEFTDSDMAWWSHGVVEGRVKPFLYGAITEELLAEVDDNYDYGVILHMTSGIIRPFDYSKVKSINIVTICNLAEGLIVGRCLENNIPQLSNRASTIDPKTQMILMNHLRALAEAGELNSVFVQLEYEYGSDGDIFNYPDYLTCVTSKSWISDNDVKTLRSYVGQMYQQHAKVIELP